MFCLILNLFSFLIGGDGTVYEGRGWNNKPEIHSALKDKDYYDIAYIGKYGGKFYNPSTLLGYISISL